jgi:hypothetical protein
MARRAAIGWLVAVLALPLPAGAEPVQAGTARVTFDLPAAVPLAGYSRRRGRPSGGTHDPVGARALVLQGGGATVALVSCDLLIVDERLTAAVRDRLAARGLPPDLALILAATHTHSGPGAYGSAFFEKLSMGHYDPQVFRALADSIVDALVQAHAGRVPVRLAFRSGPAEGLVANRMDPSGPVDAELAVAGLYPEHAQDPLAVLVNFSAHPTTLGAWNRRLSADYPGVVVEALEARYPGAVVLFFAGAAGDQKPVTSGEGFERPQRLGRDLARRAAELLDDARPEAPAGGLAARQEAMALPPPRVRLGRVVLPRWIGRRLVDDDATLSAARAGGLVWLGIPCDLASGLGAELKAAARGRGLQPMLVGFANDYIGYCMPASLYESKEYESAMAFNGPQAGELVVQRLTQMIDQLATSNQQPATDDQ